MTTPTMSFPAEVLDPRRAGEVRRYHTWPHLREQSVGEHSWQLARILLALHPEASRALIIQALVHDVGEIASGDPPYPAKMVHPPLGEATRAVEKETHLRMCLPWSLPPPQIISEQEQRLLKMAEYVEMWEWSITEQSMGNTLAAPVMLNMILAMKKLLPLIEDEKIVATLRKYVCKRGGLTL